MWRQAHIGAFDRLIMKVHLTVALEKPTWVHSRSMGPDRFFGKEWKNGPPPCNQVPTRNRGIDRLVPIDQQIPCLQYSMLWSPSTGTDTGTGTVTRFGTGTGTGTGTRLDISAGEVGRVDFSFLDIRDAFITMRNVGVVYCLWAPKVWCRVTFPPGRLSLQLNVSNCCRKNLPGCILAA